MNPRRVGMANWALIDQGAVSGVNFLTGILLARFLGVEEFGRFTLAWVAVLFFSGLQMAAITSPMMSLAPKQGAEEIEEYLGGVIFHGVIWGVSGALLLFAGCFVIDRVAPGWGAGELALPLSVSLVAIQFQDFLRRFLFARGLSYEAFLNDLIRCFGQVVLLLLCYFAGWLDSSAVLWVFCISSFAALVAGGGYLRTSVFTRYGFTRVTRSHWRMGKWMVGAALLQYLSANTFLVALGALVGPFAVGGVRAATSLLGVTNILIQAMENFVPTQASKEYREKGGKGLSTYIAGLMRRGGIGLAVLFLLFALFAAPLMDFVFGEGYREFSFVLRWMTIEGFIGFLGIPVYAGLRTLEQTRPAFLAFLAATLFSLAAAWPLVDMFGVAGVILGVTVAKFLLLAGMWLALNRRLAGGTSLPPHAEVQGVES